MWRLPLLSSKWFVKGRQFLQNLVEDAIVFAEPSERHGCNFNSDLGIAHKGPINSMPLLFLFGYAVAFPGVSHAWVGSILKFILLPDGLFSWSMALYNKKLCLH